MDVLTDERIEKLEAVTQSLAARVGELERRRAAHAGAAVAEPVRLGYTPPLGASTSTATVRREPLDLGQLVDDLLGGRVLAWLGGLALLTGIALFFTYAVSRGWLGPWARVGCGATGSAALLWFGVRLHRRGQASGQAAPTAAAAGLSGLFMSVVVASRVYGLMPAELGVGLAVLVGAAATLLAVRWNAQVIAALGIVGALLAAPIMGAPDDLGTLAILLVGAGSAVAVLLWRRWDWLAFAALICCGGQWVPWLLRDPGTAGALMVLVGFGVIGHLAAIGFELRCPTARVRSASTLALVLNTAALAIAGDIAFAHRGEALVGEVWVAALALVHGALALRARRSDRIAPDLAVLLWTVAVLLGDAAIASLVSGPVLSVIWGCSGVGFSYLASRRSRPGHGRVLSQIGLGGHLFSGLIVAVCQPGQFDFGGGAGAGGILAIAGVAGCAFAAGQVTAGVSQRWRSVLHGGALILIAYLTALAIPGPGLPVAWALEAASLAVLARRNRDDLAAVASLALLSGAGIYAGTVEAPLSGLVLGVAHFRDAVVGVGVVAVAALAVAHERLHVFGRPTRTGLLASGSLTLLYLASVAIVTAFQPTDAGVGFTGLDLAVRQQGQLLLSGLWGLTGVSVLVLGLRRDERMLRLVALGLLLLTAAKVTIYDLSTLDSIYRVASFIAIGVLLLVGARAYERVRPEPEGRA